MRETLAKQDADRAPDESAAATRAPLFERDLEAWRRVLAVAGVGAEGNTERVGWRIVEGLLRVTGADGCSLSVATWNVEMLASFEDGRVSRRTFFRETMGSRGTLGHSALRSGMPETVLRVSHDPLHSYPESVREGRFESVACFPLSARGRSLGVLSFYYRDPRRVEKEDLEFGMLLAQSSALAVDNSLLLNEGQQNVLLTVQALVRSLEAKDSHTSYHSLRVTQHATVLAEQMKLSQRETRIIQYGAMLHDIGKIGIVGDILNKKGKLTEEEYEVVRRHPSIGARIVETVDFLADTVPIIRHHHERVDGTGYPGGLVGSEIPLGARLIAIPDFYDAITSDRPYRPAYSHEKAVEMLAERTGDYFDPDIAEIFLSIHHGARVAQAP